MSIKGNGNHQVTRSYHVVKELYLRLSSPPLPLLHLCAFDDYHCHFSLLPPPSSSLFSTTITLSAYPLLLSFIFCTDALIEGG